MSKPITFTVGEQINSWVVLDAAVVVGPKRPNSRPSRRVLCQCSCGNVRMVDIHGLRYGRSQHCKSHQTSVFRKAPEVYHAWQSARQRCENPKNPAYLYYGGRGIKMAPEWADRAEGFLRFFAYIGPRPQGMSLDRINNDGNYEPGNVRWATRLQQSRNRRNNRLYAYRGKAQTAIAWAEELGVSYANLAARLKRGWTMEEAVTRPDSQGTSRSVRQRITELETLLRQHGIAVPPWTRERD